MPQDQEQSHTESQPVGAREHRVSTLKDLVEHRAYDVPAEDVAASIIRGALVAGLASPAQPH